MPDRSLRTSPPLAAAPRAGISDQPLSPPDPAVTPADTAWLALLRHELKTPLAGLLALAGQLDAATPDSAQRALLHALTDCAGQMAGLVDRLIPGDAGHGGAEPVFDAERGLERLVLAHWPRARSRGIGLHLCIGPGVPRRWNADGGRLREVLDNLLANAIDATYTGFVRLRVVAASPLEGRSAVAVCVEDTGRGIPATLAPELYRWGASGSGDKSGSGIGLFVCRRLVAELGGHIAHDARCGGGTECRVTVPVAVGPRPPAATRIRPIAFRHLECVVSCAGPAADAVLSVLRRAGLKARLSAHPDWDLVAAGRALVVCGGSAPSSGGPGGGEVSPFRLLLAARRGARGGLRAIGLPQPVVRCTWEPLLLEAALARFSGRCDDVPG